MKFISLFSGIGGFDLGLEWAGMECIGQVENDPYCQAVLAYHWPHVKRIGDIRDVKVGDFDTAGLVCGGFPCQPFSCAGKRKGKEDDRYLWPEMLRVIKEYRPAWVLGENVAGIISMELDKVLFDLEGEGYQTRAFIIPACAVDAPHRRDRVWIIAHAANTGVEGVREWENAVLEGGADVAHSKHHGRDEAKEPGSACARIGTSSRQDGAEQPSGSGCGKGGNEDVAYSVRIGCNKEGSGEFRLASKDVADPDSEGPFSPALSGLHCGEKSAGAWDEQPERYCR